MLLIPAAEQLAAEENETPLLTPTLIPNQNLEELD